MTKVRYTRSIIILHWVTLFLIFVALGLALYRDYALPDVGDQIHAWLMSMHMSVGLVIWILTACRMVVRSTSSTPSSLSTSPAIAILERSVHYLLYACLFVVPLIGLASAWVRGRPFSFFGIVSIPSPLATEWKSPTGKLLEHLHMDAAYIFLALASLHALAALYHHAIIRDEALSRITPG
jgi:cytochrome b561